MEMDFANACPLQRGENPADLAIVKPTKFETVVNLRTAAGLGIKVPQALLDRADEIIH